jgi:L-rhamnose mutarotase
MSNIKSAKLLVLLSVSLCFLGCAQTQTKRVGWVISIKKSNIHEYRKLQASIQPEILKMLHKADMRNCSIYLGATEKDTEDYYLFGYFEYNGDNLEAVIASLKANPIAQNWWKFTSPLPTRKEGEIWAVWKEVFHHSGPASNCRNPKRLGSIIGLRSKPECIIAYSQLHAATWPGVLDAIDEGNIRNYSIYLGQIEPDQYLLFSYYEYIGNNFEADMDRIANNKITQVWWTYTDPLQIRLPSRKEGEHWSNIAEVFHAD